jgi:hypothetical protein
VSLKFIVTFVTGIVLGVAGMAAAGTRRPADPARIANECTARLLDSVGGDSALVHPMRLLMPDPTRDAIMTQAVGKDCRRLWGDMGRTPVEIMRELANQAIIGNL